MPTFTRVIEIDGEKRVVERTTDAPGEMAMLRASGWQETEPASPAGGAKAPAPARPQTREPRPADN